MFGFCYSTRSAKQWNNVLKWCKLYNPCWKLMHCIQLQLQKAYGNDPLENEKKTEEGMRNVLKGFRERKFSLKLCKLQWWEELCFKEWNCDYSKVHKSRKDTGKLQGLKSLRTEVWLQIAGSNCWIMHDEWAHLEAVQTPQDLFIEYEGATESKFSLEAILSQ